MLTKRELKYYSSLNKTIKSVNQDLEKFQFGQVTHKLYDFFWHDFCDVYIEKSKQQLITFNSQLTTRKVLLYVLLTSLKLLHPFIPFITEEIYQKLPVYPPKFSKEKFRRVKKKCLMFEEWPNAS